MPKVIFKCPHIKGGTERAASHLQNYVEYMSTRKGVDKIDPSESVLPATKGQRQMVAQILRDFPLSRGMFEYEDYHASPTRGNASEFITRALEENYDRIGKRENYLKYIAMRPNAQRMGPHGLFTGSDNHLVLSQVADAVAHHPGVVWLPIISLRREDAARLGYDNAERWKDLLSGYATEIAKAMKIPWASFRWYAAFHNESHHPHIHMVCYSTDPSKGFLTKQGIADIKAGLAKEIFHQELTELYQKQTQRRDELNVDTQTILCELIEQMSSGTIQNKRIEELMSYLADRLRFLSGKKQYGYLKAPLKAVVDEIVDELAKDSRVASAYDLWYELREEILHTYKDDLPERLPLSQQPEFKKIKNIVIAEAAKLSERQQIFAPDDQQEVNLPSTQEDLPPSDQLSLLLNVETDDPPEPFHKESSDAGVYMDWNERYRKARCCLFGSKDQPQDFKLAFALFEKEAQRGNALAMYDLGRMLTDGLGHEIDMQAAHEWYAKALAAFHAVEEQKKNRYAEYRIGKLYAAGLGCEQNYYKAAHWFQLSAKEEYKYAQYSLAGLIRRGYGVEQNDRLALELYTRAAQQDFPYAAYELGRMYRDGVGCSKSDAESNVWYRKAFDGFLGLEAQIHDDKLQYRIGWMMLHGVGTEKDESSAKEWFEKAAKLGNPYAQYQMAQIILNDSSSPHTQISQAIMWLSKAAAAGQDCAQYALGKIYLNGHGIGKDIQKAVELFTLAAEQKNSFAAYALGKLFLSGNPTLPKEPATALKWLTISAELGNQFAQYQLGKLLLQGEEVPKNVESAVRWLTTAAEQGNQYAQYALGKLYLLGKVVPPDREVATKWFRLASDQGNEYAHYFLEHMDDRLGPPPAVAVISLFHHLANIFRDENQRLPSGGFRAVVDRKLMRKIKAKKIAQGHKEDDHEPTMTL